MTTESLPNVDGVSLGAVHLLQSLMRDEVIPNLCDYWPELGELIATGLVLARFEQPIKGYVSIEISLP